MNVLRHLYALRVLASFPLMSTAVSLSTYKRLEVITHHKSGTVFSFSIYNLLCFDSMLPMGSLEHYFLQQENSRKEICANVWMNLAGLYNVDHTNAPTVPDPAVKYIHFIRHPVDMLISGYLYHRKCSETWCEDPNAQWAEYLLPTDMSSAKDFPISSSYCAWLQEHSDEEGLRMELLRATNALDGLTNMISAIRYLRNQDVLTVCLPEGNALVPAMQQAVQPWNKYRRELRIEDDKNHHSSAERELQLYPIALRLILEVIPEEVLLTFPCYSAFFNAFETSRTWFQTRLD